MWRKLQRNKPECVGVLDKEQFVDIQVTSFDRQVKKSGGLFARSQRGKFHRYCPRFKARPATA